MLYRLIDDLSFFVNFLNIVHHVFNITIVFMRIFKNPNPLEMTHSINKWLTLHWWIDHYFWFVWHFVQIIIIRELEKGRFVKLTLESHIEIDYLILENIRQWCWIWNYTFHYRIIVIQFDFADDWRKWISQELNYFFWRILIVSYKHMLTFSFFRASNYQLLRTAISDSNGMNSWELVILGNHLDNSLGIRNSTVSQKEYLFGISLNWFMNQQFLKRLINLSSS